MKSAFLLVSFAGVVGMLSACVSHTRPASTASTVTAVEASYTHELVIPMQDEAGVVNDWDTSLRIPMYVDASRKGVDAFHLGETEWMSHIPSRLCLTAEMVNGEIKGNRFTAEMLLHLSNVSDNPFLTHAILRIEGEVVSPYHGAPAPVHYTILDNFDTKIHPNNAWYNPPWYQLHLYLNMLP